MDSLWADGLRLGGPEGTQDTEISEVKQCRYCVEPMLFTFNAGPLKVVPSTCPRKSKTFGDCDACRGIRQATFDAATPTKENQHRAEKILGTVLGSNSLFAAPRLDKASRQAWALAVGTAIQTGSGPEHVIRVLILEMPDAVETAWLAKTPGLRRFDRRVWEGIARAVCA
jgi:hypothetical protein